MVLCGPTGAGKSLLIELAAGLRSPDSGEVRLGERRIDRVRPERRGVGLLTQDAVLHDHLDCRTNIGFALGRGDHARVIEDAARSAGCLDLIRDEGDRTAGMLSGGERRRIALAKALVSAKALLLLDEPFAGLDPITHRTTRMHLAGALRARKCPTIVAVHGVADAIALGDRIAVLDRGRLLQIDTPERLLAHPADSRVATRFTPEPPSVLPGDSDADGIRLPGGSIRLDHAIPLGAVDVLVPADAISLEGTRLRGWSVLALERTADGVDLLLHHHDAPESTSMLRAVHRAAAPPPEPGTPVDLDLDLDRIRILPRTDHDDRSDRPDAVS